MANLDANALKEILTEAATKLRAAGHIDLAAKLERLDVQDGQSSYQFLIFPMFDSTSESSGGAVED